MSEQNDPFSFSPLPCAEDHVNEAFAKLNLREAEAPAFHAFLVAALTPYEKITPRNVESFNNETHNRLSQVINTIAYARAKCEPYFEFQQDIPEAFLIVASMPFLSNNGYSHMSDMLRNPFHVQAIIMAHRSFLALRNIDNQLAKSGLERKFIQPDMLSSLTRSERLLVELRAVQLGRDALRGIDHHADAETLSHAFGRVAQVRPLLAGSESQMAKAFHAIDHMIGLYMLENGAPTPATQNSLGAKLRAHAEQQTTHAAPVSAKKPAREAPGDGTNVVVVAFGHRSPKVL